jgi:hypothetical protein
MYRRLIALWENPANPTAQEENTREMRAVLEKLGFM